MTRMKITALILSMLCSTAVSAQPQSPSRSADYQKKMNPFLQTLSKVLDDAPHYWAHIVTSQNITVGFFDDEEMQKVLVDFPGAKWAGYEVNERASRKWHKIKVSFYDSMQRGDSYEIFSEVLANVKKTKTVFSKYDWQVRMDEDYDYFMRCNSPSTLEVEVTYSPLGVYHVLLEIRLYEKLD